MHLLHHLFRNFKPIFHNPNQHQIFLAISRHVCCFPPFIHYSAHNRIKVPN
jgi:hypothetical protein